MAGTKLWDNPVLGGMGGAIRALAKNVANRLPMDRTSLKRVVAKVIAEQRNLNHIGDINGHKYYLKNETFYMPDMVAQAKEALDDMLLIEKNRLRLNKWRKQQPATKFGWKPPDEDNTKAPSVSEPVSSMDNPQDEAAESKRAKNAAGVAKTAIGLRRKAGAIRLGKQPSASSKKVSQNLQKNLFQLTPKKVNPQSTVPEFVDLKITKAVTPAVKRKLRKPKLQSPVMVASRILAKQSKHAVATESPKRQKKKSQKKLAAPVVKAAKTASKASCAKPNKSTASVTVPKTPKSKKPSAASSAAKPLKQPTKVVNVSKPAANLPKKNAADAGLAKALVEHNKSIPTLRSVLTAPLRLDAGKSKAQFSNRVQPLKKPLQVTPRAKTKPLRRCYSKPWLPRRLKRTKSQTNSNPNLLQSAELPQYNAQPAIQKDRIFSPSMPWHEFRGAAAVMCSPYRNLNQAQKKPPKKQETRMHAGQSAAQVSPKDWQLEQGVTQKPPLKRKAYKCSQRLENLAKPKVRADRIEMRTAQSQMSVQKLLTPTLKPRYKQTKNLKVGSVGSLKYLVPSETTSAGNRNFSPARQNLSIAFLKNRRGGSPRCAMRWRW